MIWIFDAIFILEPDLMPFFILLLFVNNHHNVNDRRTVHPDTKMKLNIFHVVTELSMITTI